MHHRLKRGQGGGWEPENIVAVCGSGTTGCHGWIEANPKAAGRQGFHVQPWLNPADTWILYRLSAWALLRADGTVEYENRANHDFDIERGY